MTTDGIDELVEAAAQRHKWSIARLISIFEDQRPMALEQRARVLALLESRPDRKSAPLVAITGPPGAGKSSLVGRIAQDLVGRHEQLCCAVLAVDPSSHISGGALLGDRTRVRFPLSDTRLFFRSQASATELGGLGPWTFQVCRLLHHLFDCVFIETVGIGQSEIAVRHLAERMYLVLQPLAGDEVQFLKAGVMETPDAIILNKCDEEEPARRSMAALESSLHLARPFDDTEVTIHQTSALTGQGLDAVVEELSDFVLSAGHPDLQELETHYFGQWVQQRWGQRGAALLETRAGGAARYLTGRGGFDSSQAHFDEDLRAWLLSDEPDSGN